ncbi:MAG: hypothetical protein LBV19_09660 [Streptococcaceae bacterium]|jgi:hypothetical protein|nr:hypothetical protein [Streptococcaceae bacterium]
MKKRFGVFFGLFMMSVSLRKWIKKACRPLRRLLALQRLEVAFPLGGKQSFAFIAKMGA